MHRQDFAFWSNWNAVDFLIRTVNLQVAMNPVLGPAHPKISLLPWHSTSRLKTKSRNAPPDKAYSCQSWRNVSFEGCYMGSTSGQRNLGSLWRTRQNVLSWWMSPDFLSILFALFTVDFVVYFWRWTIGFLLFFSRWKSLRWRYSIHCLPGFLFSFRATWFPPKFMIQYFSCPCMPSPTNCTFDSSVRAFLPYA